MEVMTMNELMEYMPFLIPVIILELVLMVPKPVIRMSHHMYQGGHHRFGNRIFWILIVMFIQFLGPVVYFVFGRGDE